MKNVIIFLGFILYATVIFFIDHYVWLGIALVFNILVMLVVKVKPLDAVENIIKLLPFILLTVVINWILENYEYAILVAIKLILVCNVTYTYAKTITVQGVAEIIKNLCRPLKLCKINPDDIELLVCISLSILPILKCEYNQLREACLAKGMEMNVKNIKPVLTKLMVSTLKRVNEIEESMIEKGYGEV